MVNWLADGPLRSVLRSAGQLGSTKVLGAVFSVVALSLAGRSLGPAGFGLLVLVHTWALGANALTNFQSWQVVVRYGSPALARDDCGPAEDAVSLSFALDLSSGLAGMLGAMLLLPVVGPAFGLTGELLLPAMLYATIVPSMASATPTGALRMLRRFDLMAIQQPVTPVMRCVLATACWCAGAGLPWFMLSWYVADLVGDMVLWGLAVVQIRRAGLSRGLRPSFAAADRLPGAWRFVAGTNASTTLGACWGPVGNLIIGATLGPAAAGVYKVAATIVDAAGKPADMLTKGFYPEIMRQDPSSPEPWRLGLRAGIIAGLIGLAATAILLVASPGIVDGLFGHRYAAATVPLSIMVLSLAISMATFPLQSLLYLADRQRDAVSAQAQATVIYLVTLTPLSMVFGLAGAAAANLLATLCASALMAHPVLRAWRPQTPATPIGSEDELHDIPDERRLAA
jgi:O-antigen/teichoic acid export membrane protein